MRKYAIRMDRDIIKLNLEFILLLTSCLPHLHRLSFVSRKDIRTFSVYIGLRDYSHLSWLKEGPCRK